MTSSESANQPFALLPHMLVEEMLSHCNGISKELIKNIEEIRTQKQIFRDTLSKINLLRKIENNEEINQISSTCAVDGAYVVEQLLSIDFAACAAIAVEGLTPPGAKPQWVGPNYAAPFIKGIKHNSETSKLMQALAWMMQITLASQAPHDIIFIDGSITTPFGKVNSAMAALHLNNELKASTIGQELINRFEAFLDAYHILLSNTKLDKIWVGLPKFTSLRELGDREDIKWPSYYQDVTVLSSLMGEGEYVKPVPHKTASIESWHITTEVFSDDEQKQKALDDKVNQCIRGIQRLHITYYKGRPFLPAIRIEVPAFLCSNIVLLEKLFKAVKFQTETPGILEPYPQYMASRMVKNLSAAIPAFRQTVTNAMATETEGDLGEILINMKAYKTEGGK